MRVTTTAERRVAGFGGLQTCGSVWSCPVCASKIAATRQAELSSALRVWQGMGRGVAMVTLTMRHERGQSLQALWDALSTAWNAATSGRGWAADQAPHGVLMTRVVKTGARAGETVTAVRVPTVRVVEATVGPNGWHVHVHAILFMAHDVTDATADQLGQSMFARWSASLVRSGLAAPLMRKGGMEAHAGKGEVDAFGDYFTKAQYERGLGGLAAEATMGAQKVARRSNRTPFQVLSDVYQQGDAEDLAIWHEWERVSKGRRQLVWSPGLRDLVALPEQELTDEEIAEQEVGGETVGIIPPEEWARKIAPVPGRRAHLLHLLEAYDDGGHAALLQLYEWNVAVLRRLE